MPTMATGKRREILICGVQFDEQLRSGAMSVLELAPIAARLGAQGVEYRTVYWKDKASELPRVRQQLQQMGLKGTYATFTTLYNREPEKQRQLMLDLEDAHALGSPHLRVFRGERPGDGPEDAGMRDATMAVIDRAAAYGMRLALENFARTPGNQMSEVKEAVERLNSPVLGVNLDTSNYVINHQDPVEAVRLLGPWVMYCHLKDARQTAEGLKPTYLGNGIIRIPEIIAALDALGRDIPLCFEFGGEGDPEGAIVKSLAYMASV